MPASPRPATSAPPDSLLGDDYPIILQPQPPTSLTARTRLQEHPSLPLRRHPFDLAIPLTSNQFLLQRDEFFDTRVTGRPEAWSAISLALETLGPPPRAGTSSLDEGLATAQTILAAAGLTLPTGDLVGGAYDESGAFYPLPEMVAGQPRNLRPNVREENQPPPTMTKTTAASGDTTGLAMHGEGDDEESKERRREEKGKKVLVEGDMMTVRARLSDRGGDDVRVRMEKGDRVRVLVRRVMVESGIEEHGKVRIAYRGRLLSENQTLDEQGWKEGDVVNAMVFVP